jgi:hypothetical protein
MRRDQSILNEAARIGDGKLRRANDLEQKTFAVQNLYA